MTVELTPVEELDLNQELLDFASEHYCANCSHFQMQEGETTPKPPSGPYCLYWEEKTQIQSGMVCAEYVPRGYVRD